ncbi:MULTISPECIES: hypothetical protein [Halorubrum]|uniref:Uncharacterized protein n=1 Tax=Halorubrum sodomense TaxID=35743 RepID=A0A1I6H2C3_HALSD|nr:MULTISPECIES: hypothetical protein [Halorubrum]TKX54976.1 hypothetical protein EXE42_05610 [Halorubrum sp. SP3]TKX65433.1 hypothetical protein EXE45_16085 [Halorubrum sp. SP9]SFR48563.1 hypothetical protein SAMN04487937_2348 [Halorubrum sodomense]
MTDDSETVIEAYDDGHRIVREARNRPDAYHFDGPGGRIASFELPEAARLYADLYAITDGFDESQTGRRGVPPRIAGADEEIRMTYLAVRLSIAYAAAAFEVDEPVVRDAVNAVHERAATLRSRSDESG